MEYTVGDQVWWARCGVQAVTYPCPICYGKLRVTLILGSGDSVDLACEYCGKGPGCPTGVTHVIEYVAGAELVGITQVTKTVLEGGEKIEYQGGRGEERWCFPPGDIFPTETEAHVRCKEKAQRMNEERCSQAEHLKANCQKSYSWNAGYHLREAKKAEKQAVYHRTQAVLCKAKGKEE